MSKISTDRVETDTDVVTTIVSAVIDVRRAEGFSAAAKIDVNVPAAKTFDSEAKAALTNQSLTYTAVNAGTAGNSITVALVDPPGNNVALSVAVVASAITVTLATDGSSVITSTGDEVKALINADIVANLLVVVTGSNASPVTALAATALAGGVNSEVEEDGANTVRIPAHGLTTGVKGVLTTTGTLPAGLNLITDHFVIADDTGFVKFAASLADALAGTALTITNEGSGVHTFTPTAIGGAAIKAQKSNHREVLEADYVYDSTHWTDIAAATAITVDNDFWFEVDRPKYRAAIIHTTLAAGRLNQTLRTITKE